MFAIRKFLQNKNGQSSIGVVMVVGMILWTMLLFTYQNKLNQHKAALKTGNYLSVEQAFEQAAKSLRNIYVNRSNCSSAAFAQLLEQETIASSGQPRTFNVNLGKFQTLVRVAEINPYQTQLGYDDITVHLRIDGSESNPAIENKRYDEYVTLINTCAYPENGPSAFGRFRAPSYTDALAKIFPSCTFTVPSSTPPDPPQNVPYIPGNYDYDPLGKTVLEDGTEIDPNGNFDTQDLRRLSAYITTKSKEQFTGVLPLLQLCDQIPGCLSCVFDLNRDGIIDENDLGAYEKLLRGYIYTLDGIIK